MAPFSDMTDYDRKAWEELEKRRKRFFTRRAVRVVPEGVRRRAGRVGREALDKAREVPGADRGEELVVAVLQGGTEVVVRVALASLRAGKVTEAFTGSSEPVQSIVDIRGLDLREIDTIRPRRLDTKYILGAGGSAAAAGFVISGGEIMAVVGAAGGGAATAPAGGEGAAPGAAPGVATVAGAIAADAAATLFAAMRLIFETAAYYGYDASRSEERLRAMGVLNVATAIGQTGKAEAYFELNKLVKMIARNATWRELDENVITKIIRRVFTQLSERLTKRKLGIAVPVAGIAIGGGLNALTMSRVGDAADFLYREQFLRDKYNLGEADLDENVIDVEAVEDELPLVEIVEEEIDASRAEDGFVLQFDSAEIEALAARFSYADDSEAAAAGAAAARRGYYEMDELVTVCSWKTPRSKPLVTGNSEAEVKSATRRALERGVFERERMQALTALNGIGVPTASALLHFAQPEDYPILDVRALESLGIRTKGTTYSLAFWLRYLEACRSIAARHEVTVRTLDKALWQHSKERPGNSRDR